MKSKPARGRPSNGKVRKHVSFKPAVKAALDEKATERDRDFSWLVNYYVERGLEAERAA